jgi:hypothetical protein
VVGPRRTIPSTGWFEARGDVHHISERLHAVAGRLRRARVTTRLRRAGLRPD